MVFFISFGHWSVKLTPSQRRMPPIVSIRAGKQTLISCTNFLANHDLYISYYDGRDSHSLMTIKVNKQSVNRVLICVSKP